MRNESQPVSTRSALRRAGAGEIVEVQGGHIVRATGRKDRHSKVCTAKGPRDRRVRLSAHTAIQFYDVQDRLGYDRPSKAVDWLIKKAKSAIDELDQLPAWSPTTVNLTASNRRRTKSSREDGVAEEQQQQQQQGEEQRQLMYNRVGGGNNNSNSNLLPPSLDSDAIADTIKSFFPMSGTPSTSSASPPPQMRFGDYSQSGLFARSGGGDGGGSGSSSGARQSQDLRLSLQSFQDPMLMQSHHQSAHDEQHSLFPGAAFGNPNVGWSESQQHQPNSELGRLQGLVAGYNNNNSEHHNATVVGVGGSGSGSGGVGFIFNSQPLLEPLFSSHHNQLFTQRGPLQSSNTPLVRAWIGDPTSIASASENHHHQAIPVHPQASALSGIGFASGGFSGFHIPARIQGEEEHDGDPNKPSSASSGSRH